MSKMISGPHRHHSEENGPWQGWANLLLWLCYNCPGSKSRIRSFALKKLKPCINRGISISCLFTLLSLCLKIFKVLVSNQFHAWVFLFFCMNSRCYGYTNGNVYNTLFNILKFGSLCNWFVNESSKFVVCVWLVVCFTGEGAPKFFSWLGSILFAGSVLAHCYINHDRS